MLTWRGIIKHTSIYGFTLASLAKLCSHLAAHLASLCYLLTLGHLDDVGFVGNVVGLKEQHDSPARLGESIKTQPQASHLLQTAPSTKV